MNKRWGNSLIACFLFIILMGIAAPVFAQSKIINVDFEGVSQETELSLRKSIKSIEGTIYYPQVVNRDLKALYNTGLLSDASVEKYDIPGGVKLLFRVEEKGIVGSVIFKGNKKIKLDDLKAAVTLHQNSVLDQGKVAESRQAIRKLYEEKGYRLVDVVAQVEPLDTQTGELEVTFTIHENRQVKVRRVSFVGNQVFSDKILRKKIKTKSKTMFSFVDGSGKIKDEILDIDTKLLKFFYLNEGYLKARVGEPQVSFTRDREAIYITFPVYEGSQYKVSKMDIQGEILTTREEMLSKLKMKAGQVYSQKTLEEDNQELLRLYGDVSYAFALIEPEINTDDAAKTAAITYNIQKGQKIFIERIQIDGNEITRDKVIRREIQMVENAPYSKSAQELSERRLMQLGFFEEVNFSIPRGSRNDTVILVCKVKERQTGTFNIGAGFSSLESFIFNASVQKDNFFGYGIRGAVSTSISKLRQEFQVSMTDRYFLDTRWIVSASAYRFNSALNRDFDQEAFGGSLSFGREVFNFFDISLGYNIEDVSITNFSSLVPVFFQDNASGLTSSLIGIMAYDTRDNRLTTRKGMYHSIQGTVAGAALGGDNDFWKLKLESRYFLSFPWKTVFKIRAQGAYVNSLNDSPVPLFERYFLGGVNTLRGFDLNSVGPQIRLPGSPTGRDQTFTYGGNRMLLANFEYEVPIYDPAGIRTVAFIDIGQAYAEDESIDLARLRSNYGFGLRWNSPFGPMRFEWGFPFNKRDGESSAVFNFIIGQAF